MTTAAVELALGTVQFGMAYGVAGRGEAVPEHEVRVILAHAWKCGIRVLDTAPGYGNIEERLGELAGDYAFSIVSKIPALPEQAGSAAAVDFVNESIQRSRQRLGARLDALLFHRSEDLLGPSGVAAWRAALEATAKTTIRLGVSCYAPDVAAEIHAQFRIAVAQLPGNAFDQRLASRSVVVGLAGVEIHLRSAFLQGLLLLPLDLAITRVPKAAAALGAWAKWCNDRGVTPLRAALGVAKALPGIRYCVVGVDKLSQLEEIVAAWEDSPPVDLAGLASIDEDVIDPRRWAA